MALTTSIRIDGLDVRSAYGLEILSHEGHNAPQLSGESFKVNGQNGSFPGPQSLDSRQITLRGRIEGNSHSNYLANLNALKTAMAAGYRGQKSFTITFTDYSDRFFRARLVSMNVVPDTPVYTCLAAEIEIGIILDEPLGIYNTLTSLNIWGSPFSSPFSSRFFNQGSALTRPRIVFENVGAGSITNLIFINTACGTLTRSIAAASSSSITRVAGRWGDIKGAGNFVNDSNPVLSYASQGNFNPGCFTIFFFVKWLGGESPTVQYFFDTTGGIIQLYHDGPNARIGFNLNGSIVNLADAVSGYAADKWFAVVAAYDGTYQYLTLYDIAAVHYSAVTPAYVLYRGLPTNFFIGSNASGANSGNKYLDDFRLYNYAVANVALEYLCAMETPLPISEGTTFYQDFNGDDSAYGLANTSLTIAETIPQYGILDVDCEVMDVNLLGAGLSTAKTNSMEHVSGEFPFLVPGINGIQIIHNGSASGLNMAIEDKRRYL